MCGIAALYSYDARGVAIGGGQLRAASEWTQCRGPFVMPGRGEGFGIVHLGALACGLPIVASSLDASAEVVLNRRFGRVVNPDRPREL